MLWCIYVVLMRKKAAPHNNRIHFVLFVCVLCTMWCFVWFLHEMVLLLHKNFNYCTKRIWYLCKLQNKNFSMVCCRTLWWGGAGKERGWKTAAIIYCWQQQQHVRGRTAQLSDISSGATCVADLDSRALALTKEASGNSRARHTPEVMEIFAREAVSVWRRTSPLAAPWRPLQTAYSTINSRWRLSLSEWQDTTWLGFFLLLLLFLLFFFLSFFLFLTLVLASFFVVVVVVVVFVCFVLWASCFCIGIETIYLLKTL